VFKSVIARTAAAGRLSCKGFSDNPELHDILNSYEPFYKELMSTVIEQNTDHREYPCIFNRKETGGGSASEPVFVVD
jgi:hypothetical protein